MDKAERTLHEALGTTKERSDETMEIACDLVKEHLFTPGNDEASFMKALATRGDLSPLEKVRIAYKAGHTIGVFVERDRK